MRISLSANAWMLLLFASALVLWHVQTVVRAPMAVCRPFSSRIAYAKAATPPGGEGEPRVDGDTCEGQFYPPIVAEKVGA